MHSKRIFKFISWLILVVFVLNFFNPLVFAKTFKDTSNHWAKDAINKWASTYSVVSGYSDNTFKPSNAITRAEFAQLMSRVIGESIAKNTIDFKDVKETDWFYVAVKNLSDYISGYPDKTFRPNNYITREEAACILAKVFGIDKGSSDTVSRFSDGSSVSSWSKEYMAAMIENGYIKGYEDGTIKPKRYITRAEALTILDNIVGLLISKKGFYVGREVKNNLVISAPSVSISGFVVEKNCLIAEGVKDGDVKITNTQINGKIIVRGGGEHSIILKDVKATAVVVANKQANTRIEISGNSKIEQVLVEEPASILIDKTATVNKVEVKADKTALKVEGKVAKITVNAEGVKLNNMQIKKGSTITMQESPDDKQNVQVQNSDTSQNNLQKNEKLESSTQTDSSTQTAVQIPSAGLTTNINSSGSSIQYGQISTVLVDKEIILVDQSAQVTVTVKDAWGNLIPNKLVTIEGQSVYTNSLGSATFNLFVKESKEIVINVDGKDYRGLLYAVKPTEGVLSFKLKSKDGKFLSGFSAKLVNQAKQYADLKTAEGDIVSFIVPAVEGYKALLWYYNEQSGLIYTTIDNLTVGNGIVRIVADTSLPQYVQATLSFNMDGEPLSNYELSMVNGSNGNVFSLDDVRMTVRTSQIKITADAGSYTLKIVKETQDGKLYFIRNINLQQSAQTFEFSLSSSKKVVFNLRGIDNDLSKSVSVKLNGSWFDLSNENSVYLQRGVYSLEEVFIKVYDTNGEEVNYSYRVPEGSNGFTIDATSNDEITYIDLDLSIDNVASAVYVADIEGNDLDTVKSGSLIDFLIALKTKDGFDLSILKPSKRMLESVSMFSTDNISASISDQEQQVHMDILCSLIENERSLHVLSYIPRELKDGSKSIKLMIDLGVLYDGSISREVLITIDNQRGSSVGYVYSQATVDDAVYFVCDKIDNEMPEFLAFSLSSTVQFDMKVFTDRVFFELMTERPLVFEYGFDNFVYLNFYLSRENLFLILPVYIYSKDEAVARRQAVEQKIVQIVSTVIDDTYNEYDKTLSLHDWLALNTRYDLEGYLNNNVPYESHTAYGSLIKGVAVCNGYATAMLALLESVGIDTKEIYGTAGIGDSKEHHAWNMVNLEGDWYHIDVTWDDEDDYNSVGHYFLNVPDAVIQTTHEWDRNLYPSATQTYYQYGNYYTVEVVPDVVYFNEDNVVMVTVRNYKAEPQANKLVSITKYDGSGKMQVVFEGYTSSDGSVTFNIKPVDMGNYMVYLTSYMEYKKSIVTIEKLKPVTLSLNIDSQPVENFYITDGMKFLGVSGYQRQIELSRWHVNNLVFFGEGFLLKKSLEFNSYDPENITVYNDVYDSHVLLSVYNEAYAVSDAEVYIIDKDTFKELYVGKTDENGNLPFIVTNGSYIVKICYSQDSYFSDYYYSTLQVSQDTSIKFDLSKYSKVVYIPGYTSGGVDLEDKLYLGFDFDYDGYFTLSTIGHSRQVFFAPGDYGWIWILAHHPYYNEDYLEFSQEYKPLQRFVVPETPQPQEYTVDLRVNKNGITLSCARRPEGSRDFVPTTLDVVYEKDDLMIDIYIPTNNPNYIVGGQTAIAIFPLENGDWELHWAGTPGIYPIETFTLSNNVANKLFTGHHGFIDSTNSWRIVVLDIIGAQNSVFRIELPFVPYDSDVVIEKQITIYPIMAGSGGTRKETYLQKAKVYNKLKGVLEESKK